MAGNLLWRGFTHDLQLGCSPVNLSATTSLSKIKSTWQVFTG